jgi:rubrerythrin
MPDGRVRSDGPVWETTTDGLRIEDPDDGDAWIEMSYGAGVDPADRLFFVCTECGFAAPQRTPPGRGVVCPECETAFDRE